MKILFIGDASNMHNTLAHALRDMGHICVVASNGSGWQQTERDIDIARAPGALGALKYISTLASLLAKARGFDVVQVSNPNFLKLRPDKLLKIVNYLKRHNRHVFYSACCADYDYITTCHDGKTFRYSDYLIGDSPTKYVQSDEWKRHNQWVIPGVIEYHQQFIDRMDGIVACLYEYYVSYKGKTKPLAYAGIPIDINALQPHFIEHEPGKVKFFLGIQRNNYLVKGYDRLLEAVQRVCCRFPNLCEVKIVENIPYQEYLKMRQDSHVILDQIYSYTPATNALTAMAQGLVAISGAEPEYYDFIGEHSCQPIINVSPLEEDDIYSKLEWIVLNKSRLPELSRMSREFVIKHNESHIVAQRYIDFWKTFIDK